MKNMEVMTTGTTRDRKQEQEGSGNRLGRQEYAKHGGVDNRNNERQATGKGRIRKTAKTRTREQ
jgi:hypothetical protein